MTSCDYVSYYSEFKNYLEVLTKVFTIISLILFLLDIFFSLLEINFRKPFSDMTDGKGREIFSLMSYKCLPPKLQVQDFIRDQVGQNSIGGPSLGPVRIHSV